MKYETAAKVAAISAKVQYAAYFAVCGMGLSAAALFYALMIY